MTTAVYAVLGSALAIFGPLMLGLYGLPAEPTVEVPVGAWRSAASFARLFGITLAGLAVILWSLRSSEPRAQQKLVASLAVANVFISVFLRPVARRLGNPVRDPACRLVLANGVK